MSHRNTHYACSYLSDNSSDVYVFYTHVQSWYCKYLEPHIGVSCYQLSTHRYLCQSAAHLRYYDPAYRCICSITSHYSGIHTIRYLLPRVTLCLHRKARSRSLPRLFQDSHPSYISTVLLLRTPYASHPLSSYVLKPRISPSYCALLYIRSVGLVLSISPST